METIKWLVRWVFWLPILIAEESKGDAADYHMAKMFVSIAMGVIAVLLGIMVIVSPWFEGVRFISFFPCLVMYFIVGAFTYFLNKNTNSSMVPWQKNGPW